MCGLFISNAKTRIYIYSGGRPVTVISAVDRRQIITNHHYNVFAFPLKPIQLFDFNHVHSASITLVSIFIHYNKCIL